MVQEDMGRSAHSKVTLFLLKKKTTLTVRASRPKLKLSPRNSSQQTKMCELNLCGKECNPNRCFLTGILQKCSLFENAYYSPLISPSSSVNN